MTSRLILDYVRARRGEAGVRQLLRMCGLEDLEQQLHDENFWFSYRDKIRLFEAAKVVLGDPDAPRHIGASAVEHNVAEPLKLGLRAFGTPRIIYQNVVKVASKLTAAHRWTALHIDRRSAHLVYEDSLGQGFDPVDCEYCIGLLSCAPELFGLPPAKVNHPVCALRGADRCEYQVTWEESPRRIWRGLGVGLLAGVAIAALIMVLGGPASLYAAALLAPLVGAAIEGIVSGRKLRAARWRQMEERLEAHERQARQMADSLRDLVSDLRLEEVLAKIIRHAQIAAVGKRYALVLNVGGNEFSVAQSSDLPGEVIDALEGWASSAIVRSDGPPFVVDDVAFEPMLAPLGRDRRHAVKSLTVAPLLFKGERLGMLIALSEQVQGFLPRDVELIGSYAAQAAAAIANARLYEEVEIEASRDPLTGLLNHREFHETLNKELDRCSRYGMRLSVVMLDLDGFKQVNDTEGHGEGDRLLHEVGREIESSSRASDLAFRIGGDEFAVLLPETGPEEAITLSRRIDDAVAARDSRISISSGIASWPDDGADKEAILRSADLALYAAKHRKSKDRGGAVAARRFERAAEPGSVEPTSDAIAGVYADLERAYASTLAALSGALEAKDSYSAEHARQIAETAVATGERLGLGAEQLRDLHYASLLHDIGKISVPDQILGKAGVLTPDEADKVRHHAVAGEEILSHLPFLANVKTIVRHAHERWDGNGYPDGLAGQQIPIGARIVFVADAYHAMTSDRAYRPAMDERGATRELRECAGSQFDPRVVEAFLEGVQETV